MKRHACIVLCLVFVMTAWAVPARRGLWRVIHLSDGSTVRVELRGDENQHWWEDSLGNRYPYRGMTKEYGRTFGAASAKDGSINLAELRQKSTKLRTKEDGRRRKCSILQM